MPNAIRMDYTDIMAARQVRDAELCRSSELASKDVESKMSKRQNLKTRWLQMIAERPSGHTGPSFSLGFSGQTFFMNRTPVRWSNRTHANTRLTCSYSGHTMSSLASIAHF